jgi:uncharacterized protein (DUF362 family)
MGEPSKRSIVSVVKVRESVLDAVAEAMTKAHVLDGLAPDADVLLKPNLGFDLFFPGAVTSPWAVEGVIRVLRGRVKSITIIESDQVLVDIEKAFNRAGFERLLKEYNLKFVNMSKGRFVELPVPNPRLLKTIRLPELLTRATLVTIPVMKTHDKTEISGAIKNQWGCLDVLRHNYHLAVGDVLSDIHKLLKPAFAVCDATIALEGDGPKTGKQRIVDRVLASRDIVALDAVCARIMGFDPLKIKHLRLLSEDGIGSVSDYEIAGEDIAGLSYGFRCASHNAVSMVELAFRKSLARRLVFETPVFDLMCFGANIYYLIWYYMGPGKKVAERIIRESRYGAQWR